MSSTTKADRLKEQFGQNIAQVVGQRGRAGASPASPPAPESDKYAGAVRSRTFGELPVSALVCESQARTEFDAEALDQLTTSIRRFGQLTPIRVRHDASLNRWVVLVGERRLRACRAAGLERVRVEFVERAMGESDILAEQVVENVARADLRPVELGHAYQRLLDLNGWTAQELAEQLGVEPTSVYRALALLRLPEDVAAQVDSGAIGAMAAYEVSKVPDAEAQRELAERLASGELDYKGAVAEAKRRRPSKRGGKSKGRGVKLPRVQNQRGPRGVRVSIQASARHTLEDVVSDLRSIADRLEAQAREQAA